jgi:hypothetical protein
MSKTNKTKTQESKTMSNTDLTKNMWKDELNIVYAEIVTDLTTRNVKTYNGTKCYTPLYENKYK